MALPCVLMSSSIADSGSQIGGVVESFKKRELRDTQFERDRYT
jgi:hypothetical protein